MAEKQPVAIAGGGMVGLGCALALAHAGISSTVIESQNSSAYQISDAGFDDRSLVVNPASLSFWQQIGLWPKIADQATTIDRVHVSHQGQWGVVHFDAQSQSVDQLGYVISAQNLAHQLWQMATEHPLVDLISEAQVEDVELESSRASITVKQADSELTLDTPLLLAADGARSGIRAQLGLSTSVKNYNKTAIVSHVQLSSADQSCAYERLTTTGPLALLPASGRRHGVVWSVDASEAEALLSDSDDVFKHKLNQALGPRLGEVLRLGRRSSYPIYQVQVPQQVKGRCLLLGNAAHTVSPVSAQGLNLAVRGIHRLCQAIESVGGETDWDVNKVLAEYERNSKHDQSRTLAYTDDLMRWFADDSFLSHAFKAAGMWAVDSVPALKRHLFLRASGRQA